LCLGKIEMSIATLTSKGQTTIPKDVRDRLRLKPGDRLEFLVEPDGRVLMVPAKVDVGELKGLLAPAKRRASLADMDKAISDGAAARVRRGG
jgi:AbrB family looped-hinge helix DNA binding protein